MTTDTDECIRMRPSQKVDIAEGSVDGYRLSTPHSIPADQGRHNAQGSDTRPGGRAASIYYDVDIETDPTLYNRRLYGHLDLKEGYRRGAVGTVLHHINGCRQGKRRQPPLPTDCQIGILLNNLLNKSTIIINQSN